MAALALSMVSLQSCLDFDEPGAELNQNETIVQPSISTGRADSIDYMLELTQEQFNDVYRRAQVPIQQALTGIYAMRGGKEGGMPQAHSYQYQFCLSTDNYAQFATVPHSDFMAGTLKSTYAISKEFNDGPNGAYGIVRNALAPALNNPVVDSIPEIKALYLLLFNYSSVEVADIYGPLPYQDFKDNRTASPFVYNDLRTVYYTAKANVDSIVKCLKHYETRPDWYKGMIQDFVHSSFPLYNFSYYSTGGMDIWRRFANSFKLRLALHLTKIEPETAKQWAEEAVADGVIEKTTQEVGLFISFIGCNHPLAEISGTWGDTRLNASFESLLMSLGHPYASYLFDKNSDPIANVGHDSGSSALESTPANARLVGMRGGVTPGITQAVANNQYIAYSKIKNEIFYIYAPPLYLMKLSEVCFLRAEGALRGWNMGGSAESFYNEGIKYAYLEDRDRPDNSYLKALDEYMERAEAIDYTYVDPSGNTPDMPSVTKIGVKWNEADDLETKLEKIITQKYIAAFPYSYEPWVDLRRTGYPKLFPVLNPGDGDGSLKYGDIIRRMVFGAEDPQTIQDINDTGLPALGGPDQQATRLWWDVDKSNF